MNRWVLRFLLYLNISLSAAYAQVILGPVVVFKTNLGDIEVQLLRSSAPRTVSNFLAYMQRGAYNGTIFHRSVPNFVIQAGGFRWGGSAPVEIPQDPPVRNEFGVSNTRGTIAMAKLGDDPNSATNQWFFNLSNNTSLNSQNGGFTVFGRIRDAAGLAVMDRIAAVPVPSPAILPSPFDQMPLLNYGGGPVTQQNLVIVESVTEVGGTGGGTPTIADGGVITASAFGGFASAAPGSFIEIYGTNLSAATRGWASTDFADGNAPIILEQVTATVGDRAAYVNFVSPGQVNVQVPANIETGSEVNVIVRYAGQSSAAARLTMKSLAGGILAPASFKTGDRQFAAAIHSTSGAFVSNGSIPNVTGSPAAPGEVLIFYGTGFGPVTPDSVAFAGRVVTGLAQVVAPVEFKFAEITADVQFAGLVPGLVGVYQFNVRVPPSAPSGDLPLTVSVNGEPVAQTLFLSVGR